MRLSGPNLTTSTACWTTWPVMREQRPGSNAWCVGVMKCPNSGGNILALLLGWWIEGGWGGFCCRDPLPSAINPNYNIAKQLCVKCIHDKIRSKSPPNRATSLTCLHCDVTHISLTTGIVALDIPSWRVGVYVQLCGQVMKEEEFVKIIHVEPLITIYIYKIVFWRFK